MPSRVPDAFLRNASPEEALAAFAEEADRAAASQERANKLRKDENDLIDKGNKGRKQSLMQRLASASRGAAIGAATSALRQGLVTSNTTDAGFLTGAQNAIEGAYSGLTGANANQRAAIGSAGDQTFNFFADAVRNGAEIPQSQIDQVQKFFTERENRTIALKERVGGNVERAQANLSVEARGKVITDLLGQIGQDLSEIKNRFR